MKHVETSFLLCRAGWWRILWVLDMEVDMNEQIARCDALIAKAATRYKLATTKKDKDEAFADLCRAEFLKTREIIRQRAETR